MADADALDSGTQHPPLTTSLFGKPGTAPAPGTAPGTAPCGYVPPKWVSVPSHPVRLAGVGEGSSSYDLEFDSYYTIGRGITNKVLLKEITVSRCVHPFLFLLFPGPPPSPSNLPPLT
jgi:hypothetical protein